MKFKKKLSFLGLFFGAVLSLGVLVGITSNETKVSRAESSTLTYSYVTGAEGNNDTWGTSNASVKKKGVTWKVTSKKPGSYNSGNYCGQQFGDGSNAGSIQLETNVAWGAEEGTYSGYTVIKEIRMWLNNGSGSVTTYTISIGGAECSKSGTVSKNSSAKSYKDASKVVYTPGDNDSGVIKINVSSSSKAFYWCAIEIDCETAGSDPVTGVQLDKTSLNLVAGQTSKLTATVLPETAGNRKVTWSSDDEDVATVSSEGLVTAVAEGDATITVTTVEGSFTATCDVTVTQPATKTYKKVTSALDSWVGEYIIAATRGTSSYALNGSLSDITVAANSKSITIDNDMILEEETVAFTFEEFGEGYAIKTSQGKYIGRDNDSNGWNVSDTPLLNTISYNTEPVIAGSAGPKLQFLSSGDNTFKYYKSSQLAISLFKADSAPVPVTGVQLDKTEEQTIMEEETLQFNATVLPTTATNKKVTWSSDDEDVATVSDKGLVTAVAAGDATITVTTEDGGYTASCNVKVIAPIIYKVSFDAGAGSGTMPDVEVKSSSYLVPNSSFTAPTGYKFSHWIKQGDPDNEILPGATITLSGDITLVAQYVESKAWPKVTDDLQSGDYVITSTQEVETVTRYYAMTNVEDEKHRMTSEQVTVVNDEIEDPWRDDIWTIEDKTDYWTISTLIYDEGSSTRWYLASTGAKNQATLVETVTDNAKWRLEQDGAEIDFVNIAREKAQTDPNNKYLRCNIASSQIWACYASSMAPKLTLFGLNKVPGPVAVTGVEVSPKTLNLGIGNEQTLTATVKPSNATDKAVSWSTSDSSVATVDANGKVKGVAAGTATITVTTHDGNKTDTCVVTVIEPVHVTSVTVSPKTDEVFIGEYTTLSAKVLPDEATEKGVTWSSSDTSVATVDEDGKVTGISEGTATITATSKDVTTISDSAEVTVKAKPAPVTTKYTKVTANLDDFSGNYLIVYTDEKANKSYAFDGSLEKLDVAQNNFEVTVSNNEINADALKQFTVEEMEGGYSIQAANGKYIGWNNTSKNGLTESDTPLLNTISVTDGVATITSECGKTLQFNNINDDKSTELRFRYYVDGKQQAISLYKSGSQPVPPSPVHVTGVELSSTSLTLEVNGTSTLRATVKPDNATDKSVTWSSSDSTVASVENGVVTAKKVGTAVITVTTVDGGYTATCNVTVQDEPVVKTLVSIVPDKTTVECYVGDPIVKPIITAHYSDGSTAVVTDQCTFTGFDSSKVGTCVINVSYTEDGITKTCSYVCEVKSAPTKVGCGGSIVATSVILSTLALAGAGVILLKKKKED